MENGELRISQREAGDKTGYSEVKVDRDLELQAGQWLDLKSKTKARPQKSQGNVKTNTPSSTLEKLITAIGKIQSEVTVLTADYIEGIRGGTSNADTLLIQITQMQTLERSLLKALKWEQQGELDITKLPKEAQNLLK